MMMYELIHAHSKMNDCYRTPSELAEKTSHTKRELKAAKNEIKKLLLLLNLLFKGMD